MDDKSKLIMTLEASNERTARAFAYSENDALYIPPDNNQFVEYNSRQTTPSTALDDGDDSNDKSRLILTFGIPLKDIGSGFVFGSNPNVCDILIGSQRDAISARHFSITFDSQRRPIVWSRRDTKVSYNGQLAKEGRQNFIWILFERVENIEVIIGKTEKNQLRFRVKLGDHSGCKTEYQNQLDLYLAEAQNALGPINNLYIHSQESTAIATDSLSPKQSPLYYRDLELGRGEFGIVQRAWDVSTGLCYAEKEFLRGDFTKEVEIMRALCHVSSIRSSSKLFDEALI